MPKIHGCLSRQSCIIVGVRKGKKTEGNEAMKTTVLMHQSRYERGDAS